MTIDNKITALLEKTGPLTGFQLWNTAGGDLMDLWRTCMMSERIEVRRVGADYLRLDRRIEGYARLSPSVLRGFLTYSVAGLHGDPGMRQKASLIEDHIRRVSLAKMEIAFNTVSAIIERLEVGASLAEDMCTIIAGDVVYGMAHDMPRPERSTRKIVNGSDMDLIFLVADHVPDGLRRRLDEAIYEEKIRLLMAPHLKEEIDYVVKDMARVAEQLSFDTFPRMVACKILNEGKLLYGSRPLFESVKKMLDEQGITGRLDSMELTAVRFREKAQEALLKPGAGKASGDGQFLFYPAEESEEFE